MDINTALWALQIILGIKMLNVSYSHGLRQSQPTMQAAMQKLGTFSGPFPYAISICAFIGALGLILPGVLASSRWLISVSAMLLSVMLLFSVFFHIQSRQKPKIFVSVILFVFAALIAYGRWVLAP